MARYQGLGKVVRCPVDGLMGVSAFEDRTGTGFQDHMGVESHDHFWKRRACFVIR
jgi:hypothetical protein